MQDRYLQNIGQELVKREETVAVAESLTSGNVAALLGSTSGASNYFQGGVTAYSLQQKVSVLGVDKSVAEPVNCVSKEVAQQMSLGIASLFQTDYGIGTTGYADAWGDITEPFAFYAISYQGEIVSEGKVVGTNFNRQEMQKEVAGIAIKKLHEILTENE
jgi:nicotinamide-nucleotide amidase